MAETYAHERLAGFAAQEIEVETDIWAQQPAYMLGAMGPDLLFFHYAWIYGNRHKLPTLGVMMHQSRTNLFFEAMMTHAYTSAQRAYTLGFLSHFALDHSIHPYIYAQCQEGRPFAMQGGHGYLETAIDSTFYLQDCPGQGMQPPLPVGCTTIGDCAMEQVDALLRACVKDVFGKDLPQCIFGQATRHMRWIKCALSSPTALQRKVYAFAERTLGLRAVITSHCYAPQLPVFDYMNLSHSVWHTAQSPQVERTQSVLELFDSALRKAMGYMEDGQHFWTTGEGMGALLDALGDRSYHSDVCRSAKA